MDPTWSNTAPSEVVVSSLTHKEGTGRPVFFGGQLHSSLGGARVFNIPSEADSKVMTSQPEDVIEDFDVSPLSKASPADAGSSSALAMPSDFNTSFAFKDDTGQEIYGTFFDVLHLFIFICTFGIWA